jgi:hypothetical protein
MRPDSKSARRDSISLSHARSAGSSNSSGLRVTRNRLMNSCRWAGGSATVSRSNASTCRAMALCPQHVRTLWPSGLTAGRRKQPAPLSNITIGLPDLEVNDLKIIEAGAPW